jgi:hypothetical protein
VYLVVDKMSPDDPITCSAVMRMNRYVYQVPATDIVFMYVFAHNCFLFWVGLALSYDVFGS